MSTLIISAVILSSLYMALNVFIIYSFNSAQFVQASVMTLPAAIILHTCTVFFYLKGTELTSNTPLVSSVMIATTVICAVLFSIAWLEQSVNQFTYLGMLAITVGAFLIYMGGER